MEQSDILEEGEIIDDDDLEDISDSSIVESFLGKLVSPNEHLRALSLSSDDNVADLPKSEAQYNNKKKLVHRKSHRTRCPRKRKRHAPLQPPVSSDSSDSEISSYCGDIKNKLKEAIRISFNNRSIKNDLGTRLKAMSNMGQEESESANTTPEQAADPVPQPPEDKIDDHELENLRIEALKTAIINKCQRRKRKKALESQNKTEVKSNEVIANKENNTPANNSEPKEAAPPPVDLDEDEDLLRAKLLAALAQKITKPQQQTTASDNNNVKLPPQLPIKITPALTKIPPIVNNAKKKVIQNVPKMLVKPLIINVNPDSDSDDEMNKPTPSKVGDITAISTTVDNFLKEQRAKFETQTKKVNQKASISNNTSILEKSAVKLLPKSQQLEYQRLLRQLKNAERRKKIRRAQKADNTQPLLKENTEPVNIPTNEPAMEASTTVDVPSLVVEESKKKVDAVVQVSPSCDKIGPQVTVEIEAVKKNSAVINELTSLQKALKEMRMQKNGSLQMKTKYQVLTPIMKKITMASNERKKYEKHIKILLDELDVAKRNLSRSHEKFASFVRELVNKKEQIDRSNEEQEELKKKLLEDQLVPEKMQLATDEGAPSSVAFNSTNHMCEDMDICHSDETDLGQIDIVDPNDIDQIFRRRPQPILKNNVPEYVSPLNVNCDGYQHVDPYGIMCPYEVNGSCRDLDCTFKHYLKNYQRR